MKKPVFIIGKKQIVMACMTMILGIAVYVNYVIADNSELKMADNISEGDEYG